MGPDGAIVPDVAARLPGRGLWLTARRDIVDRAVAKRLFARAARRPVVAPAGLARRAGLAVAGFDRVGEAVRRGKAALLLAALDGAVAGRRKLAALGGDLPSASVLTATELGAAFGRDRIVHAVVGQGPLCERLRVDLGRLAGLRAGALMDSGLNFTSAEPAQQDGGIEAHD